MNEKLNCPGCGGSLTISSSATVFVTCSYCRSSLIKDRDWSLYGKAADLPPEETYLQVGTQGKYKGESFDIIGRRIMRWEDGVWNEWCASFSGQKFGFIAEAQGTFAMCFEVAAPKNPTDLAVGARVDIDGRAAFRIKDQKRARVVSTEGEMPYVVQNEREYVTYDGGNDNGEFAGIEHNLKTQEWSAFVGEYLNFDDFQFQHLRQLDDW